MVIITKHSHSTVTIICFPSPPRLLNKILTWTKTWASFFQMCRFWTNVTIILLFCFLSNSFLVMNTSVVLYAKILLVSSLNLGLFRRDLTSWQFHCSIVFQWLCSDKAVRSINLYHNEILAPLFLALYKNIFLEFFYYKNLIVPKMEKAIWYNI